MLKGESVEMRARLPSKRTTKNSQKQSKPVRNAPDVESEDSDVRDGLILANATGKKQKVYSKKLKMTIIVPPTSVRMEVIENVKAIL